MRPGQLTKGGKPAPPLSYRDERGHSFRGLAGQDRLAWHFSPYPLAPKLTVPLGLILSTTKLKQK